MTCGTAHCALQCNFTFKSVGKALLCGHSDGTEKFFDVVQFTMLHRIVLAFKSVDKILTCDHSNEKSY